jgi:hypothetical protein
MSHIDEFRYEVLPWIVEYEKLQDKGAKRRYLEVMKQHLSTYQYRSAEHLIKMGPIHREQHEQVGKELRKIGLALTAFVMSPLILVTSAIILQVGFLAASAYEMTSDVAEMGQELFHQERIMANLTSLSFASACIAGAVVIALAISMTNPVGWALAIVALAVGTALLIKGARATANKLDSNFNPDSLSKNDSRFKLSASAVKSLKEKGLEPEASQEAVSKLATRAAEQEKKFFMQRAPEYNQIINELRQLKKGEIPEGLKTASVDTNKNDKPEEDDSSALDTFTAH